MMILTALITACGSGGKGDGATADALKPGADGRVGNIPAAISVLPTTNSN
jgi:hypothetical protein